MFSKLCGSLWRKTDLIQLVKATVSVHFQCLRHQNQTLSKTPRNCRLPVKTEYSPVIFVLIHSKIIVPRSHFRKIYVYVVFKIKIEIFNRQIKYI